MDDRIVIIALSFGKRADYLEPNPVNMRLGAHVRRFKSDIEDGLAQHPIIVAQWEIARWLDQHNIPVDKVVTTADSIRGEDGYLDSEDVIRAARSFVGPGAHRAVIVANPYFHLDICKGLAEKHGFVVMNGWYPVDAVGFDPAPEQLQWWCKGKLRFLLYGILVKSAKAVGVNLHGFGERKPR